MALKTAWISGNNAVSASTPRSTGCAQSPSLRLNAVNPVRPRRGHRGSAPRSDGRGARGGAALVDASALDLPETMRAGGDG